jgi:hypothetical protein
MSTIHSVTEFNLLTSDEKAWYLWHGATFLHVYEHFPYRVNLFHLNNFYIELWYCVNDNRIERIHAFTSLELLEPFLNNIHLGEIVI